MMPHGALYTHMHISAFFPTEMGRMFCKVTMAFKVLYETPRVLRGFAKPIEASQNPYTKGALQRA